MDNFLKASSINKKNKFWLKILLGVIILFGLVFALNVFSSQIKNYFYTISSPAQNTLNFAGKSSSGWFGSFLNATNLYTENEHLKRENQKLLSKISNLQSIQEGNQALSTISATCQENNFATIMAGITGLDNQDMLTINKGSEDGIKEGMPVIDQYNVLYGKILRVYKNYSQVMLISNKNSVVNAEIQQQKDVANEITTSSVSGVVKGNGGLAIYLDLVPVDDSINNGDILITSAIDQNFPKNILIGKLEEIQKNDQKPFQQAKISHFFDLGNVENLFVITNYKTAN